MAHHQTAPIHFGLSDRADDLFKNYTIVFVLTDQHTAKHCLPFFASKINSTYTVITIPSGEEHKTLHSVEQICQRMLDAGADRKSLLVNLGGGVVLDTGGFAASMYMRGIDFVNIPTTLLAMVDASIGGKTGVDLKQYKNIIGFFSEPTAVFIEPAFLKTLPERDLRNGFAEMIKHGLIANKQLLERTYSFADHSFLIDESIIRENILIKKEIVETDFKEAGLRKLLNFGHTIGHAIESTAIGEMLHGECIAIGMVADLYLSNKLCGFPDDELFKHAVLIRNFYKDIYFSSDIPEVLNYIKADKKSISGSVQLYLLKAVGEPAGVFSPDESELEEAILYAKKIFS